MTLAGTVGRTFSALRVPNFRRYMAGQTVSLVGTWMQSAAIAWVVLTLTHSAADVGLNLAMQTLPVLLFGPYGGVVADRVDKRRMMVVLQSLMGLQALTLGVLTLSHHISFTAICLLSVVLGLNNSFENPSRQAFINEMVGRIEVRNAVSLGSTMVNVARAIGPAIGGVLISVVGAGWCFVFNAASFAAVVVSLATLDRTALHPAPPATRERGQLREGVRYVRSVPDLLVPLAMMVLIGTLAFEFQVTLPVLASRTFHGGSESYGFMMSCFGIGAAIGGLLVATFGRTGRRPLVLAASVMGGALVLAALAPSLRIEYVCLFLTGLSAIAFLSLGNSTIQVTSSPNMRGRVLALWAVAMIGSTPIGGPVVGWICGAAGARAGLVTGAAACLLAAALAAFAKPRRQVPAVTPAAQAELPEGERATFLAGGAVAGGAMTVSS